MAVAGEQSRAPEVSIIRPEPRGQEKSHYICCHTKSLSRCAGESTHTHAQAALMCGWIARNTSDASQQPPATTQPLFPPFFFLF